MRNNTLGWRLERADSVQLGYQLPGPGYRPGRGRKISGWILSHPEELPNGKHFDRKSDVEPYLVQWGLPTSEVEKIMRSSTRRNASGNREPLTRASYPSIFGDTDEDQIPDVDDPHPFRRGDVRSIEEVRLSDEVGHLLEDREAFVPAMEQTMAQLRQIGISGSKVEGRVKTPFSLVNKLRRKYMSALTDVAGTRIIVPDQRSLERAQSVIERDFEILEKEDFYAKPLAGYRAIHYIVRVGGVPVELQLKTHRMAEIADASHTPYKRGLLDPVAMDRLTSMAAAADAGDKQVAREIDAILSDPRKVKQQLTRKQNPRTNRMARRVANGGY